MSSYRKVFIFSTTRNQRKDVGVFQYVQLVNKSGSFITDGQQLWGGCRSIRARKQFFLSVFSAFSVFHALGVLSVVSIFGVLALLVFSVFSVFLVFCVFSIFSVFSVLQCSSVFSSVFQCFPVSFSVFQCFHDFQRFQCFQCSSSIFSVSQWSLVFIQ